MSVSVVVNLVPIMATAGTVPALALLVVVSLLAGCETLDQLAVAESHRLDEAPYYVNLKQPLPAPGSCVLVLPATIDPGLAEQFGYGDRLREFEPLTAALNARLANSNNCSQFVAAAPTATGAPRVFVGSSASDYAPPAAAAEQLSSDRFPPMVLYLDRPTAAWRGEVGALMQQAGSPYAIAIQLGVSQYQKGYSGVFRKEVALGTGNTQPIKFMTSEVKPVEVLHITGVLVDASGQPVRAGAEGIVLRDTRFLAQAIEVSREFDSTELQRVVVEEQRRDLPGAPLKLDVALDNLIAQLTRGTVRVPASP